MPFKKNNLSQKFTKSQYKFVHSNKEDVISEAADEISSEIIANAGSDNRFISSKERDVDRRLEVQSEIYQLPSDEAIVKRTDISAEMAFRGTFGKEDELILNPKGESRRIEKRREQYELERAGKVENLNETSIRKIIDTDVQSEVDSKFVNNVERSFIGEDGARRGMGSRPFSEAVVKERVITNKRKNVEGFQSKEKVFLQSEEPYQPEQFVNDLERSFTSGEKSQRKISRRSPFNVTTKERKSSEDFQCDEKVFLQYEEPGNERGQIQGIFKGESGKSKHLQFGQVYYEIKDTNFSQESEEPYQPEQFVNDLEKSFIRGKKHQKEIDSRPFPKVVVKDSIVITERKVSKDFRREEKVFSHYEKGPENETGHFIEVNESVDEESESLQFAQTQLKKQDNSRAVFELEESIGVHSKLENDLERGFSKKEEPQRRISRQSPFNTATKEGIVTTERKVSKNFQNEEKIFSHDEEAGNESRKSQEIIRIENGERKPLISKESYQYEQRDTTGEAPKSSFVMVSNIGEEIERNSKLPGTIESAFVESAKTQIKTGKISFGGRDEKVNTQAVEEIRADKNIIIESSLTVEDKISRNVQITEEETERKEKSKIFAEELSVVLEYTSEEAPQLSEKNNEYSYISQEGTNAAFFEEASERDFFDQKQNPVEYQSKPVSSRQNCNTEDVFSVPETHVDDEERSFTNERYGFIKSVRPEFINDIETNAEFVKEKRIVPHEEKLDTVKDKEQIITGQRDFSILENDSPQDEKQYEYIEVTKPTNETEFIFWRTEKQESPKTQSALFKKNEKSQGENFISKYDRFIDKFQKAFEKSKEDEEDDAHVSRVELFAEGVLEYRLAQVVAQQERYQGIWSDIKHEEKKLKRSGKGIFHKKSFVEKGEQFEKLNAKKKAIKKAHNKEIRKAARLAAATKVINAKRNMQSQLGNMKGEASGDLIKDGSRGGLSTFLSILKDIGAVIRRKVLLYLVGLLGPAVTFMLVIMISSIVLLSTVSAVVTGIAADSDSGENYSLDINGDGRVYTSLTEQQISDIIYAVNEIYGGISWKQEKAIYYALSKVGCEYNQLFHHSLIADKFDCSSLVYRAYREAYVDISNAGLYTAADECYRMVTTNRITDGDLAPGDLIFYGGADNGRYLGVYHVAMYVGNMNGIDKMVEARGTSWGVVYCDVRGNNVVKIARPY